MGSKIEYMYICMFIKKYDGVLYAWSIDEIAGFVISLQLCCSQGSLEGGEFDWCSKF